LSTTNKVPLSVVVNPMCRKKTAIRVAISNAAGAFFFIVIAQTLN